VTRSQVAGSIHHAGGKSEWVRLTGTAKVIDAHTLELADGSHIPLMVNAPDLDQTAEIDGKSYACGEEAAEFVRNLIGDNPVDCYFVKEQNKWMIRSGERNLEQVMISHGWALSHHSTTNPDEIFAREHKLGLWRGTFVDPENWREAKRRSVDPRSSANTRKDKDEQVGRDSLAKASPLRDKSHPGVVRTYDRDRLLKITGTVEVLDAHTLRFLDGTEIELNGGMDAPEIEQTGRIDNSNNALGQEAFEFLKSLADQKEIIYYHESRRGTKLHGDCFIGETCLQIEMVRNGWALSHHTGMDSWQMIASDNKRGMWRGEFVRPEDWRKGKREP
jgi:endonuclease YncB( thermonuclease family)